MVKKTCQDLIFALFIFTSLVYAGQNAPADVYIDMNVTNDGLDSIGNCQKDSLITVGIFADSLTQMYSIEADIEFDTSSLQYISYSTKTSKYNNFLESNGGSTIPVVANYQSRKNTVSMAVSLLGSNEAQCVKGGGYIGFITFKRLNANTTSMKLFRAIILDFNEGTDIINDCFTGKIGDASMGIHHIAKRNQQNAKNSIKLEMLTTVNNSGGSLRMDLIGRKISVKEFRGENGYKRSSIAFSPKLVIK